VNIVLPNSNNNIISSTGRRRGGHYSVRRRIGWQSDISPYKRSTSVHPIMGSEQLGSSEYSDFQQQESGNCWGAESLDTRG
jgi:hypothetical protein